MSSECWTDRYNSSRVPDQALLLQAPLRPTWSFDRGAPGLGIVRSGFETVLTNVGKGFVSRLLLDSGEPLWINEDGAVSFIHRWNASLLVGGSGVLRCLDVQTGKECWRRNEFIGLQASFVLQDTVVGATARDCQVVDLPTLESLWHHVFEVPSGVPLLAALDYVIAPRDGISAFELRTGTVRWHRPETDFGGPSRKIGCVWDGRFIGILGDYITALDLETGETLWRNDHGSANWLPYQGRAYNLSSLGRYLIQDLTNGEVLFERELGAFLPARPKLKKKGLTVGIEKGKTGPRWRDPLLAVSETHTFVANGSGQIVVLERDTGEIVQVAEIPGMPRGEPIIYENHLLLTDFNAAVHCFQGTT